MFKGPCLLKFKWSGGCLGGDQDWSLDLLLLCHKFSKVFGQLILYSLIVLLAV